MSQNKLSAKLFISGTIEAVTGMHIGGSTTALDIGGIDLNVIKTAEGVPYIPGSSLKGKMRSLYERTDARILKNYKGKPCGCGECEVCYIFGTAGDKAETTTRLIVRDAFLDKSDFNSKRNDAFAELELDYTEGKWENTIDRVTSKAEHPRQLERVPAGAKFNFEMVYNLFNDTDADNLKVVIEAMRLLEDDYLGGSGSRGYGQVKFQDVEFKIKALSDYEGDNNRRTLTTMAKKHIESLSKDDVAHLVAEVKKLLEKKNESHPVTS